MFTFEERRPTVACISVVDENNNVVCVINALKFAGARQNLDKTWNVYLEGSKETLTLTAAQFKQLYEKLLK
jgi:hypothetical protein